MDSDFILDPAAPPATYRLAPRRTRYRTVAEPPGRRPRVTNPVPADEVWQEVEKPVDEDTHTLRGGIMASVMKVDDEEQQPARKRREDDEEKEGETQEIKTIHLPENLCEWLRPGSAA